MINWTKNNPKKASLSAILLLAMPVTAQFEGLRTKAYLDPIGIPTICIGETENVHMGDVKTVQECKEMFTMRLGYFAIQTQKLVTAPVSAEQLAAYSSLSYNIGLEAFKKSSVLRLANEGKKAESCDFMLKYVYAGGKKLQGLVKRRLAERELCLK